MSTELTKPELPAIGFVADMGAEERRLLSSYGEFIPAHKDTEVIRQGDPQDSLFLVIAGSLHVSAVVEGRTTLLGTLHTGDMLGEVNIFDPGKASATVSAIEFSQLWRIDRQMLEDFLNENPMEGEMVLIQICTQLSRRLRATNEKLALAQEAVAKSFTWS